jgi:hypothetical protein
MMDESKIEFIGQVYKVQTLATDSGIRLTLNMSEGETVTMAKLAECQRFGVAVQVVITPIVQEKGDVGQSSTISRTAAKKRK